MKNPVTKFLPYVLIIGGLVGLLASFVITLDKIELLKNPGFVPSCSLNPVISCGTIMKSAQAEAFGFPNPIMGLVGYTAVVVVGVTLLAAWRPPRWYWLTFLAGATFGIGFVHWLIGQSLYHINALCPWCMGAWVATAAIFWYTLVHALAEGHLPTPKPLKPLVGLLVRQHWFVLATWYLVVAGLAVSHFWYYFKTLIPS
jgi:uncharacterized membrane protein